MQNGHGQATSSLRTAALLTRKPKRRKLSHPRHRSRPLASRSSYPGLSRSSSEDREEGEISEGETATSPRSYPIPLHDESDPRQASATEIEKLDRPVQLKVPPPASVISNAANFARPNLSMTAEQLWEAKLIILDLLGWGVSPSYLQDYGLTREAIYYTFTELRLKLPEEFNTDGLVLLDAETGGFVQSEASTVPLHDNSASNVASSGAVEGGSGQWWKGVTLDTVTLPPEGITMPKRHVLKTDVTDTAKPPALFSKSLASDSVPPTASMLEIEQQRRMELLARKAVVASRKVKAQTPMSARSLEENKAVGSQVDDFLNSIASPEEGHAEPFLTTSTSGTQAPRSHGNSPLPQKSKPAMENNEISEDLNQPRPMSAGLQRRGSKRPVASDFVDGAGLTMVPSEQPQLADNSTHPLRSHSLPEQGEKGFRPDFANVGGSRRCVIEFSDDEEAEGGDDDELLSMNSDLLALLAKEDEIKKLRERIERARLRKVQHAAGVKTSTSSASFPITEALEYENRLVKMENEDAVISGKGSKSDTAKLSLEVAQSTAGDRGQEQSGNSGQMSTAEDGNLDSRTADREESRVQRTGKTPIGWSAGSRSPAGERVETRRAPRCICQEGACSPPDEKSASRRDSYIQGCIT